MESPKILIIDDDRTVREIYSTELSASGYEVQTASNGEDALKQINEFQPDAILLDLMMPKIDGLTIVDIIKGTPETQSKKVIVFSALGDEETQEKAKALGADGYIVKSEKTMAEVVDYIRGMLGV